MILTILFILDIIYAQKVPLFNVLTGTSYGEVGFMGIPMFHNVISSFAIFYSMYLAYIYFCFKDKKVLMEYGIILLFFLLLVQRQNVLVCVVMFCNIGLAKFLSSKIKMARKVQLIAIFTVVCIIILYLFGVFGNMRYGSSWDWNDSWMITTLGKKNDKYPKVLPLEYFWGYTYLVTPLANLNYNIMNVEKEYNIGGYVAELVPEFISRRISLKRAKIDLPVSSLNASTAYTRTYITGGYLGIYIMFMIQIALCTLIAYYTYQNNRKYFVIVCNILIYFLLLAIFDNSLVYTTTAFLLVYSIACSLGVKFELRQGKLKMIKQKE